LGRRMCLWYILFYHYFIMNKENQTPLLNHFL
jgi:hypothetical protein